ncbi:MAG TPA: hypothetical protein VGZ29_06685 [Terriglobia bacterium]|nr:hypothetical protein [Terriglobia bacterium]
MDSYRQQWAEYKRRRNTLVLLLLGYIPAVIAVLGASRLLFRSMSPAYAAAVLFMIPPVIAGIRFNNWPCPQCGKSFHSTGWTYNSFARKCLHCGLKKYAAESDAATL